MISETHKHEGDTILLIFKNLYILASESGKCNLTNV